MTAKIISVDRWREAEARRRDAAERERRAGVGSSQRDRRQSLDEILGMHDFPPSAA